MNRILKAGLAIAGLAGLLSLSTGCASTGLATGNQLAADHPANRPISRSQFNASLDRMLGL